MSFLERPITILKMGLRQHEAILAPISAQVASVMKSHDWTCHKCGVRIPDYMQIDHTMGHGSKDPKGLKPICAFCHDQDHLLWAAGRKRVFPILAPEMSNEHISRLAWAVLALQNAEEHEGAQSAIENITASFRQRHHDFQQKYGSADADSAIEAVFRFLIPEEGETDKESAKKNDIARRFVAETRFVPKFLSGATITDPSESVATWSVGGFTAPARTPAQAVGLDMSPDTVMSAVSALIQEGAG